jgi:periplasmic protein TonB
MPKKNPKVDLKLQYRRVLEISLIIALFILIGAFKFFPNLKVKKQSREIIDDPTNVVVIPPTGVFPIPPPPPTPQIPLAVPSDIDVPDIVFSDPIFDPEKDPLPPPAIDDNEDVQTIFIAVEEMPEIIGGIATLQSKIMYPEIARKAGIHGKVILQAVVNKNGKVSDITVFKGIGAGCDEAAIKALKEAKFKPGKQRGKEVNVRIFVPIVFALQ